MKCIAGYAIPFMQLIKIPQALIKKHEAAQLIQHMSQYGFAKFVVMTHEMQLLQIDMSSFNLSNNPTVLKLTFPHDDILQKGEVADMKINGHKSGHSPHV